LGVRGRATAAGAEVRCEANLETRCAASARAGSHGRSLPAERCSSASLRSCDCAATRSWAARFATLGLLALLCQQLAFAPMPAPWPKRRRRNRTR
jgi:hypothetical protein